MIKITIATALLILVVFGCKKKTDAPTEPEPTTTGTTGNPVQNTKIVSIAISTSTIGGKLTVDWDYEYGVSPGSAGLIQYTLTSASQTFSSTVPVSADSTSFGYTGPPPNNTPISYTVYVNGNVVKSDQNTMTLGAFAKTN